MGVNHESRHGGGSLNLSLTCDALHRAAAASPQEIDAKRRKRVQPSFSERSEAGMIPVRTGSVPGPVMHAQHTEGMLR